jgi:hypothetical protein
MSYELIHQSTQTARTFSKPFWAKALELARNYGWKPMGTCPPADFDFDNLLAGWDGRYLTNDGQIVKRVDAFWIADALERSLADVPDASVKVDWNAYLSRDDDLPEWLTPEETETIEEGLQDGMLDVLGMDPLEYFAGEEKRELKMLIRFCRLGSFVIQ